MTGAVDCTPHQLPEVVKNYCSKWELLGPSNGKEIVDRKNYLPILIRPLGKTISI